MLSPYPSDPETFEDVFPNHRLNHLRFHTGKLNVSGSK